MGLAKVQAERRLTTADAPMRYASTVKASSPRSTRISSILPIDSPFTSRTFVPRSRSMLICIVDLLFATARNVLDDVTRDPDFPCDGPSLPGLQVQLDFPAGGFHVRPGDSHRLATLGSPHS